MNKIAVPPIKCQGIKTKLVPWIKAIIPDDFTGKWIEPFAGSGVVAYNIRPKKALLCDTNPHLIKFYNSIKDGRITSDLVRSFLEAEGAKLRKEGQDYYYEVRERFNTDKEPLDFLFLNRSCFNGMIRFNKKGGFNVPFCRKPRRFEKAYVTKIVNQVAHVQTLLQYHDFEFRCQDFELTVTNASGEDMIYCDPPYIGRHVDYYNGWDETHEIRLSEVLDKSGSRFILSTWHSNDYRENKYLKTIWRKFNILTREHFYHIGGFEKNRNPMLEALVTNFKAVYMEEPEKTAEQLTLFEKRQN
ncbi:DNA adenine methylase [Desulfonema ishimotonii]|uniref:Site-specific DNA-methyltransferase (adenine-specific) n=1 Tax=Desulfonema ishimotonii TaxID=45657 RepID=A0A401G4F3_9BACT|nr:Dam family site-specific DNA-(adenine-N6)-methyltransferase [Desulfonema ishimotonii]GBC64112.1 DNA adenine methylase [Desulfonema ishimotonii]